MKGDVRFKTDELGLGKGRGFVRIDKLTIIFVVLISLVKTIWERNSIVAAEMQSGILCATSSSKNQVMVILESYRTLYSHFLSKADIFSWTFLKEGHLSCVPMTGFI